MHAAIQTTDQNPFYDSFVRWQMNILHEQGRIKFGKRNTIYSIKDGQPCMDHDRSSGEALGPQEYTGIKMEVVDWAEAAGAQVKTFAGLEGKKIFLVAATLRPETMYGQTNCFVGPDITYGLYESANNEVFVITNRAARNMAYQAIFAEEGVIKKLGEIKGRDIVGTKIKAPFGINPEVWVLPMDSVLPSKGTGVVTSVPSDSPDDYANYMDLRKKAEFYKIQPEWVAFDIIPVVQTPNHGDRIAEFLCKEMKIQSPKDVKQLAEAKEIAYKEGFFNGTLLQGDFKGETVQDGKQKVKDQLIAAGLGFKYAEPEGLIMSRSADECVVALVDQWYINYGEDEWRKTAERYVSPPFYGPVCSFPTDDALLSSRQTPRSDEHLLPRDPKRLRGCPRLAQAVGLLSIVRSRIAHPLGESSTNLRLLLNTDARTLPPRRINNSLSNPSVIRPST